MRSKFVDASREWVEGECPIAGLVSNLSNSFTKWRNKDKHNTSAVSSSYSEAVATDYDWRLNVNKESFMVDSHSAAAAATPQLRKRKAEDDTAAFSKRKKSVCCHSTVWWLFFSVLLTCFWQSWNYGTRGWLGGSVVRTLDSWSRGYAFHSYLVRCPISTLGKLFMPTCLCHQAAWSTLLRAKAFCFRASLPSSGRPSVRLSVCHTRDLYQNGAS